MSKSIELENFVTWMTTTYGLVVDSVPPINREVTMSYGNGFTVCKIRVEYDWNYDKQKNEVIYSYWSMYNQKAKAKANCSDYREREASKLTRTSKTLGALKTSLKKGNVVPTKNYLDGRIMEDMSRYAEVVRNSVALKYSTHNRTYKSKYDLEESDMQGLMQYALGREVGAGYTIDLDKLTKVLKEWDDIDVKDKAMLNAAVEFKNKTIQALGVTQDNKYIYGVVELSAFEKTNFIPLDTLENHPELQSMVTMASVRNEGKRLNRGLPAESYYDEDLGVIYLNATNSYINHEGGIAWMMIL